MPFSSHTRSSAFGSSAAASRTSRSAIVLPIRGIDPMSRFANMSNDRHEAAALVGAERDRGEQVVLPGAGQRPRGLADLVQRPVPDTYSTSLPGCSSAAGSGHTPPKRPAQPAGELVPPLDDLYCTVYALTAGPARTASRGRRGVTGRDERDLAPSRGHPGKRRAGPGAPSARP